MIKEEIPLLQLDKHIGNAPFGYLLFSLDELGEPELIYVNQRVCDYTGLSKEECLTKGAINLLSDPVIIQAIKDIANDGIEVNYNRYISQFQKNFDICGYSFKPGYAVISIRDNTQNFLYQNAIFSVAPMFSEIYFIVLDDNYYKQVYPFNNDNSGVYTDLIVSFASLGNVHIDDINKLREFLIIDNIYKELENSDYAECDFRCMRNGKYEWYNAGVAPIKRVNGTFTSVTLSVRSIDAIVKQELSNKKELEAALEAANSASVAKTTFLSTMSHDIRTPLNVILGMTKVARLNKDNKVRLDDVLNKIETAGKHLLTLINEVLDMSKIESGKIELAHLGFVITNLMGDTINMLEGVVTNKKQNLFFNVNNIQNEAVIGDFIRLQQILINIIGNASKYTPNGGNIHVTVSETPSHKEGFGVYNFCIKDNGIGMSEEFIHKIYEPFAREEDSRVSKIEGTGLGMAIALNLIKLMGGDISVESTQGVGTEVYISIPLEYQKEQIEFQTLENHKILIVDDFEASSEAIVAMLEELKAEASYSTTCEEAIERIINEDFTMVLLDYQMPEMNGIEFSKVIRRYKNNIPIVLITGYEQAVISDEARDNDINYIMAKPIFKSHLAYALNKINVEEKLDAYPKFNINALLVEDNELNVEIALEFFDLLGIKCDVARDGKHGLEKFKKSKVNQYDCIFMDVEMPRMNGIESTKHIRALNRDDSKNIPIFAMTANAFSSDVKNILESGMNEHIAKPISFSSLVKTLLKWFE